MACAIELEVDAASSPGEFRTRVVNSPAGGSSSAVVQLDVDKLLRDRDALETLVLASSVSGRRVISPHEQQLRRVGQLLFETLFSGGVLGTYRASVVSARQRGEPLRIVLRLNDPRLAALPWEALFDPETEAYICRREPLVRYVPAPYTPEPLNITPPLRVLGLVASPRGMPLLDVSAEQARLAQALAAPSAEGLLEMHWLLQARWESVHEQLLSGRWHVLHFIGHGEYDVNTDQGLIALVGSDGRPDMVEADRLADLLHEARPTPRLVVLNSCSSGEQGTHDLFSGTAAALVRSGISAVAAMQFTVSDPAAIAFAKGFYTAIAHGRTVDDATRSGRIEILGTGRGTLEWVTPVLHVFGEATQLFDFALPPGAASSRAWPSEGLPDLSDDPQWNDALYAHYAKRWSEAVDRFEALLARYPTDTRVTIKLEEARRRRDIDAWSSKADSAATNGDWEAAVIALENLVDLDPMHPDAGARLDQARIAQQRRTLDDEMTGMHQAGRSDAGSAIPGNFYHLGLDDTDPRDFASYAMMSENREAEIDDRYAQALRYLNREWWPQAADMLTSIEQEDSGFREVAVLLKMVKFVIAKAGAQTPALGGLVVDRVRFDVDGRQLLDNISLIARPGSLVGIVGGSGVGKTTLARLIAGYTRPNSGMVTIEGHDIHHESAAVRRRIAMVPQDDVVHRQLTVNQALGYASELRFPRDTTKDDRAEVVARVLEELDLTNHADTRIGMLSGGQRKRASMALELLNGPSLLILDEPTFGLDPALDRQVMVMLRQVADAGRVVLVITHSLTYLDVCDQVLMLAPGGRTAFCGPPSQIGPTMGTTNWADIFSSINSDPQAAQARYLARTNSSPPPVEKPVPLEDLPQPGQLRQFSTIARRQIRLIVRDRGYFAFMALLPFVLGWLSRSVPDTSPRWTLVLLTVSAVFVGTALTIRDLINERAIFFREHAVGLSTGAYVMAKIVVFGVFAAVQSAIMTTIVVVNKGLPTKGVGVLTFPGGWHPNATIQLFIAVAAISAVSTILGLAISSLIRSREQIMPLFVISLIAQLVLCGGMIAVNGRVLLDQLSWMTPARWGFAAAASTIDLDSVEPLPSSPKDSHWNHTSGAWWVDMGMLAVLSTVYGGLVRWRIRPRRQ